MKCRCKNPRNDHYHLYGGRGIRVCEDWKEFKNFYKWAMENGYEEHLTIDRIDPDGNYEPSNCRWSTYQEQNLHLRQRTSKLGVRNVKQVGNRYEARVRRNNKEHYIGLFKTIDDAIVARDEFIKRWECEN